ncbi:MAG: DUF5618 family protein [Bacteroidota bacterium]|nr:DUF5618 family protein [Bacteroidota bacterium]
MELKYKNEAIRYLDNAKEILSQKAHKEGEYYQDPKYIKMAGNTAWSGVLVALNGYLNDKNIKKEKGRVSIDWYKEQVAKLDKKMLNDLNSAYNYLHLLMGYNGDLSVKTAQTGLELAQRIINKT